MAEQGTHNTLKFLKEKFKITTKNCEESDYHFVLGIVKKMIFPFVEHYFTPDEKMFSERFTKDYKERTILIKNNRRIGYYQLTPHEDHLQVSGIFLSSNYQGKGIGKYLMEYFETLGYTTISLQVWENNPAINFYKKIGYQILSKTDHKYVMQKKIGNTST